MIIFYIFVLIIGLWGVSLRIDKNDKDQYLSKESTNAIKGICILLVFLRHANQYVRDGGYDYSSFGDKCFLLTDSYLDQLIVVMFLFFSGYGVYYSIMKKGRDYVSVIPKHRILNTLINFDIAVVFYIILSLIIGKDLSLKQILLSFVSWESVGNSNWYIFVIIICYLTTWLAFSWCYSFKPIKNKMNISIIINIILLFMSIVLLVKSGKGQWWYDTIFVYILGMLYCKYRGKIENFFYNKKNYAIFLSGFCLVLLFSFYMSFSNNLQFYGSSWLWWMIRAFSAIMITLLIMMRVKLCNKFIVWLGINLFPLYIYQRLPMIIVSTYISCNPFILITLSFFLTCLIVPLFKKIEIKL